MQIYFFAGRSLPVHSRTLDERPLGGTETALIYLADCLARRGHEVVVFTTHKNPALSNPRYVPAEAIYQVRDCDVLVALQDWKVLLLNLGARKKYFWTGDSYDQFANFGLGEKRVHPSIDRFLAVSDWHARTLCEESGFPFEKSYVIRNGVNLEHFEGAELRNRKRLFYSSNPRRGLQFIPELYAELAKRHADLELHIYSALDTYDQHRPMNGPEVVHSSEMIARLNQLPGCVIHGSQLQKNLAREFMKSGLLFYPNIYLETSCITAMEAIAAGCPVVTSEAGALPETIQNCGFTIPGVPGTSEYSTAFVEAADLILSNEELWNKMSSEARERAFREFSWEQCADRFEKLLELDFPGFIGLNQSEGPHEFRPDSPRVST
jgi:glycosyltransferase involved in cell wall biosynthesis